MAFESRQIVRFADIDRAGIVYYPRFFDFWHRAFEDFFTEEVALPYYRLIDELRVGFPIVHVESDFHIPLAHGDVITIRMTTARLGNRSITMRYRTFRPGSDAVAAEGRVTQACVDMNTFKPIPVPELVRAALARHLEEK
jgi:4-hydroxybenzoyl-CoA thioesterase